MVAEIQITTYNEWKLHNWYRFTCMEDIRAVGEITGSTGSKIIIIIIETSITLFRDHDLLVIPSTRNCAVIPLNYKLLVASLGIIFGYHLFI